MEPVIGLCLFDGQALLINGARTLRELCVDGIKADRDSCKTLLERSIGIVTALNPVIGYDKSTELAALAMKTGKGILQLVREKKVLTEAQIKKVLDPKAMTGARRRE
jgi:aspartate ammonia-lyase